MGGGGFWLGLRLGGGFCGGRWYWGEAGLRWWGSDLQVVGGIDGGFG